MASTVQEAPQVQPHHARRAAITWIVLSIIGSIATAYAVPKILPQAASGTADFANLTIVVFTVASIPVAMFVWVFLGYSLVHFRVRAKPIDDGPALQPSMVAQVGWLGITSALCLFLLIWGLLAMYVQVQAAPVQVVHVNVEAQQWTFTYTYPQYGVTSHTLELPISRPAQFNVKSSDVLHGFEIEELGVRTDANPDQPVTTAPITPNRTGDFYARCVELCGLYHSFMFTPVKVVSNSAFKQWLVQQGGHA